MSDENSLSQKAVTLTTVPLALHQILTGRRQVHCAAGAGGIMEFILSAAESGEI